MKAKILLIILLALPSLELFSQQNLVPNGDMNTPNYCPNWAPDYARLGWNMIHEPDHTVLDSCNYEVYIVSDTFGRGRSGCTSFVTYQDVPGIYDFRYVPRVQLTQPLVAGQRYYFEMYVKQFIDTVSIYRTWGSYYYTDHQQVGFSKFPLNFRWTQANPLPAVSAQISSGMVIYNDWTKVSGCFDAEGGERYLYIGNFASDAATIKQRSPFILVKPQFAAAIYLVDDVFLTTYDLDLPDDTTICASENLLLDATFPPQLEPHYQWSNGAATPQITVNQSGKYKVDIYLGSTGCAFTDSVFVTAIPDPGQLNRTIDTTFCKEIPLVLVAGEGIPDAEIRWNDGATEREKTVRAPGTYSAEVSVRCGSWTETYHVQQADCKIFVFFPNAFTPNGDGLNETFFPIFDRELIRIRNWNFEIYDRWGERIFQSDDPDKQWDGLKYGKAAQEGIYVWRLVYEGQKSNGISNEELNGTVMLMR